MCDCGHCAAYVCVCARFLLLESKQGSAASGTEGTADGRPAAELGQTERELQGPHPEGIYHIFVNTYCYSWYL